MEAYVTGGQDEECNQSHNQVGYCFRRVPLLR